MLSPETTRNDIRISPSGPNRYPRAHSIKAVEAEESLSTEFQARWRRLMPLAAGNSYAQYQSPEWFTYLSSHEPDRVFRPLAIQDSTGDLVGVVPRYHYTKEIAFGAGRRDFWRFQLSTVSILGCQPLVPSSEDVYDMLFEALASDRDTADLPIYFHSVPVNSHLWSYLRQSALISGHYSLWMPDGVRQLHSLELPASYDSYLGSFKSKTRTNLKKKIRLIEAASGPLRLDRVDRPEQTEAFLQASESVIRHAWQRKLVNRHVFQPVQRPEAAHQLAGLGLLRSYILWAGATPVGLVLGYQYEGMYHFAETAFMSELGRYSPGLILIFKMIEDLINHKAPQKIVFGIGDAQYKQQFGNLRERDATIILVRKKLSASLLMNAHRAWRLMVDAAKAVVAASNHTSREKQKALPPRETEE